MTGSGAWPPSTTSTCRPAAYLPGQYTRFAGFAGRPEGGLHFAGEHTAPLNDQGYLEGAVRTGVRAAREVLRAAGGRIS